MDPFGQWASLFGVLVHTVPTPKDILEIVENISFEQSSESKFSVQDNNAKHFHIPFTFATNNNKRQAFKTKGTKLYNQGTKPISIVNKAFVNIYKLSNS